MTVSLSPSAWVRRPHPLPQAQLRLFCFPYAGGDASLFHTWPQALPAEVADRIEICPIQLPGRAHRIHEPLFTRVSSLIDVLVPPDLTASPLYPYLDKPFAFFGASLGGLLAFETAYALDVQHQRCAVALCVAAARAPQIPGPYGIEGGELLGDAELVEQIRALGGTAESILSNEKHMRLILPKIRADAMMAATYVYIPRQSLDCPITVCGGINDAFIPPVELAAWQAHTRRTFRVYTFAGDHFFVRDVTPAIRAQLLECVVRTVRDVLVPEITADAPLHRCEPARTDTIPFLKSQPSPQYSDPFVPSHEQSQVAPEDMMQYPNNFSHLKDDNTPLHAIPMNETTHDIREPAPTSRDSGVYDPATSLSAIPIPSSPRKWRPRKERQLLVFVVAVLFLILISVALLPMLFAQPSSSPLTVPSHRSMPISVGQLSFMSSGQLDPNSNTGLNDIISLNLDNVVPPPAGMSLYAWLLSDKTQDSIAPILLGRLQVIGRTVQFSYQNPQHADLLVAYSRCLITAQDSKTMPSSPPLETKTWRYQGRIADIPTPGDEQGYSLLSHMRHLLAKDPTLTRLGISGGLDIWLYRNTGKIFEWSNAARDDWAGNNMDILRRLVDRVVQYIDGQLYAWRDLPANTPWMVDSKIGRPGLIDFTTAQNEQGPASYLSHVRLHLIGMVYAPGHTDTQKQLASRIDVALTRVETTLKQVRKDAVQLAKMSNAQLKSQNALMLLNDMQVNASNAYIGQTGETPGSVSGVAWIHTTLQQLAQMDITVATPNHQ